MFGVDRGYIYYTTKVEKEILVATLRDLRVKVKDVENQSKLFGTTRNFNLELKRYLDEIGEALARENDMSLEEANHLPPDTVFGEKSNKLFVEFCHWLDVIGSGD